MAQAREIERRQGTEPVWQEERHRVPAVDICETDDSMVLTADMPGVGEKGLEVSIEEDRLCIVGKVDSDLPEGASALYTEYEPLSYRREFTLSPDVRREAINGTMRNGVLRLTIPKAEAARVKKIPIKTE